MKASRRARAAAVPPRSETTGGTVRSTFNERASAAKSSCASTSSRRESESFRAGLSPSGARYPLRTLCSLGLRVPAVYSSFGEAVSAGTTTSDSTCTTAQGALAATWLRHCRWMRR